jgi:hypothetical protein
VNIDRPDVGPPPTGRLCIFCGSLAGSEEHMFPRWLNKVFDYNARVQGAAKWTMATANPEGRSVREFGQSDIATLTTGFVCEICNTGWMAELESQAIPVLTPFIERRAVSVGSPSDTLLMATWATKTAMTLLTAMTAFKAHWPTPDECEIVRTQDRPPSSYGVYAAALRGPGPALSYAAASSLVQTHDGGHLCDLHTYTIQLGGLVLQVNRTAPSVPLFKGLDQVAVATAREVPLFPPVKQAEWPPKEVLDWDGYIEYTTRGISLPSGWAVQWENPGSDF